VSAGANDSGGTLTVGTMGPQSWMIKDIVERFRTRCPAMRLLHSELNTIDPLTSLRSGEIDVAHLWLPLREPDITVGPVTHTSPIPASMEDVFQPWRTPSGPDRPRSDRFQLGRPAHGGQLGGRRRSRHRRGRPVLPLAQPGLSVSGTQPARGSGVVPPQHEPAAQQRGRCPQDGDEHAGPGAEGPMKNAVNAVSRPTRRVTAASTAALAT
jgi:hypothetical protein